MSDVKLEDLERAAQRLKLVKSFLMDVYAINQKDDVFAQRVLRLVADCGQLNFDIQDKMWEV